jgi:hypothetical protein
MKRKVTKPSNVHAFGASGAVKTVEIEGGRMMQADKPAGKKPSGKPAVPRRPKIQTSGFKGVRVGEVSDPEKWRCAVCKHLNDEEAPVCATCQEPKTVMPKMVPAPAKAPHKAVPSQPAKHKDKPKDKPKAKTTAPSHAQAAPQAVGGNIHTLKEVQPKPESMGAPKEDRKWKDNETETLKVTIVNDGIENVAR